MNKKCKKLENSITSITEAINALNSKLDRFAEEVENTAQMQVKQPNIEDTKTYEA